MIFNKDAWSSFYFKLKFLLYNNAIIRSHLYFFHDFLTVINVTLILTCEIVNNFSDFVTFLLDFLQKGVIFWWFKRMNLINFCILIFGCNIDDSKFIKDSFRMFILGFVKMFSEQLSKFSIESRVQMRILINEQTIIVLNKFRMRCYVYFTCDVKSSVCWKWNSVNHTFWGKFA